MKVLNINVEGMRHLDTVFNCIEKNSPDVVCMQEANTHHKRWLEENHFYVTHLPTRIENRDNEMEPEGVLLASTTPHQSKTFFYHKPQTEIILFDKNDKRNTGGEGCIYAHITINDQVYSVATTHFTWTPDGSNPNEYQQTDLPKILEILREQPPHILCGDMNIPRGHNFLYEQFTEQYQDAVPKSYTSSLDQDLHRLGPDPSKAILFSDYMVDYIFTQAPYRAEHVRLEFGVSDHAAVVADIFKE